MKKRTLWLLIPLLVLVLALVSFNDANRLEPVEFGPITRVHRGLSITTDPRVELVSIIQYISDNRSGVTGSFFPYRQRLYDAFWQYRDHAAVKMYEEMAANGFVLSLPPIFALYLTMDFEINENLHIPDYLVEAGGGEENLRAFAAALQEFIQISNFRQFFLDNGDYYQNNHRVMVTEIRNSRIPGDLASYTGVEFNCHVIFVPLYCGQRNYAHLIESEEIPDLFIIYAPDLVRGPPQQWESKVRDEFKLDIEKFKNFLRYHYSNYILKSVPQDNWADLESSQHLFEPIKTWMQSQGYLTWEASFKAHVNRAVIVRVTHVDNRKRGGLYHTLYSQQRGFTYLDPLLQLLTQEYEKNREQYPTLESFLPRMIELLQELSEDTN
jgi:hypothetical protein